MSGKGNEADQWSRSYILGIVLEKIFSLEKRRGKYDNYRKENAAMANCDLFFFTLMI